MTDTVIIRTVSYYPKEETIIQRVAERYGLGISAALRYIINDYQLRHDAEATSQPAQPPTDGDPQPA